MTNAAEPGRADRTGSGTQVGPSAPAWSGGVAAPFFAGAVIGVLGGLVGLGGAEFRLPLLIGLFGFAALQAIILNKAMSLVVVLTALPARLVSVPFGAVAEQWTVAANLLVGSLAGAWIGATWATRMRAATLYRVLAGLLVLIAAALAANHAGVLPALDLPSDGADSGRSGRRPADRNCCRADGSSRW